MQAKNHWEGIYSSKPPDKLGWYQEHAELSLQLVQATDVPLSAAIIDVGGGASTLVDDLLAKGYENLTVLDISGTALAAAQCRLGSRAGAVAWLEADILDTPLPTAAYDLWHDRAVFHFLTSPEERRAYVAAVLRALKPGGHLIVATFADDGPAQCSGLPVVRYTPEALQAELGTPFELLAHEREFHRTPAGAQQSFLYCCFRNSLMRPSA